MGKYLDFKNEHDYSKLKDAAKVISNGGLVLFPTETVYGIGANGLCSTVHPNVTVYSCSRIPAA